MGSGGRNVPWVVIVYLSLYCATQGLYDVWDEAYELTYLKRYGVDLELIALTQTMAIVPWCFKVYISMPSDILRVRLPFMALGLLICGGIFMLITRMDPKESFAGYTIAMMIRNVGVALADGATEGFSVDCKLDEISGTMQAWMQVGRMTGMIVGAAIGGVFADRGDYNDLLIFLAVSILCFIPVNFLVAEETDPLPYDPKRVWGALFLPFLYSRETVEANLAVIKAADQEQEAADREAAKVAKLALDKAAAGPGGATPVGDEEGGPLLDDSEPDKKFVDGENEFQVLLALCKKTPVACFIFFVFLTNLGTYIASFPIVPYLQDRHDFLESEVGLLTVIGCVGNMVASFGFGYLFDYISSKRFSLALAAAVSACTYLFFLPSRGKGPLYMAQFAISAGTGLLYTVQCAMVRLLADERVGGSFFGVVLSSQNIAALIGTALGGVISAEADGVKPADRTPLQDKTGYDGYEWCYLIGALFGLVGIAFVPWISAQDPNLRDAPPESLGTSLRKLQRRASVYLGLAAPEPDGDGAALSATGSAPPFSSPIKVQGNPLQQQQPGQPPPRGAGDAQPQQHPGWMPPMGSMRNIIGEEGKGWKGLFVTRVFDRVTGRHKREVARELALAQAQAGDRRRADDDEGGDDDDEGGDGRSAIRGSHAPRSLTAKAAQPLPYVAGARSRADAPAAPRAGPALAQPPPPPPSLPPPSLPAYSQPAVLASSGARGGSSLMSDGGVGSLDGGGAALAAAALRNPFGAAADAGGAGSFSDGGSGSHQGGGDSVLAEAQRRERIVRMGQQHLPAAAALGLDAGERRGEQS